MKILVVDDEQDVEVLVKQKFRKEIRNEKYHFFFAGNGVEALKVMEAEPEIPIVVTDINMPEMDGLELLRHIDEMKNPMIKVIIISAYNDWDKVRTAMNHGAFDFLTKPIDLDDLEKTIDKTIKIVSVIRDGIESRSKLQDYYRDLDAAKEIQQAILPRITTPFAGIKNSFDIYGKMEAALQVGGDFFDYFVVNNQHLGFVIGDVSGKGMPSAIFMAVARTLIHSFGKTGISADECLLQTNNILCSESVDSMFVTVFYGILNVETGEVSYTNAGHNYPYIVKNNGIVKILNEGSGVLLGAFEGVKFTSNTFKLEVNDTLLLYTDGVNEAEDADDNQLGDAAFMKHLQELQAQYNHPKQIVDSVFELVKNHTKGHKQSDDITVLAITYKG